MKQTDANRVGDSLKMKGVWKELIKLRTQKQILKNLCMATGGRKKPGF